ncbi:GNAT family N-acetyltransferase [Pseudalkalibacillus caeni]|uniref:GNAT family N-acetyltransferase n=1 Tax=Exobacillus caeni TaxID=2574798 RepID=UPI0014850918|nr:GNAT family N-acetyltransferase [Pseudalkalibacillus caeni]
MFELEPIDEPLDNRNVRNLLQLMNSNPDFNRGVLGRTTITEEDLKENTEQNLNLGANYFYVKKDSENIGLIHYLPKNPHDGHTWIGLLIIDKRYQQRGVGTNSLRVLEGMFIAQKIGRVRLCVQHGNSSGADFWKKNGFTVIDTSVDEYQNQIDIYEKQLKVNC